LKPLIKDSGQSELRAESRRLELIAEQQVVEQQVVRLLDTRRDTWQGTDNFFAAVLKQ